MIALVKLGQIVDEHVLRNVGSIRAGRELFSAGSLELAPGEVRLLVNHDRERVAGRVSGLRQFADTDGRWYFAACEIDDAPAWLRRGTPASFAFASIGTRQTIAGWERVNRALVSEVSLLGPGVEPFEARAEVWSLRESPPLPAGEILENASGVGRRYCGGVVSVR